MLLNNEQLMGLAEMTWKFARVYLADQGEFSPQVTLVDPDGEGISVVPTPDCPISDYDLVWMILEKKPSSAFIFVGEAWSLPPERPGESLMMVAVGHDFSLERVVDFHRDGDNIEFDEERPRSDFSEGRRFFNLRELLVRPEGKQDG